MSIEFEKIKLIDSHNFIPMPLSKFLLKKTLGFHEMYKGYFPNLFNTPEVLFGSRTNASKLYHICSEDEKIKYFDVTSLYPFVQKTGAYPFGSPTIITEVFDTNIDIYFGLIQCKNYLLVNYVSLFCRLESMESYYSFYV